MATTASRVLGFARDVLTASLLGTGPAADAFIVAFRIPNLVRRVLGEGGLHAGLVPVERAVARRDGEAAARRFAGEALASFALALVAVTALFQIAAPLVVAVMAPGFADGPEAATAVLCLRLSFPLVVGASIASLASALLVAQGRFGWASWSPVVVNALLVALLAALDDLAGDDLDRAAAILAGGSALAGLVQAAIVLPPLMRSVRAPILARPRFSPDVKRLLALAGPGLIVVASTQLAVLIALQVASDLPGAVSRLHYADRVAQLPLGFVASALGIVALPEFARNAARSASLSAAVDRSLSLAFLVGLPAAAGLALLAEPVASVLFQRGSFTAADAAGTATALAAMAAGLPFAVVVRVMSSVFFARETPRPALAATAAGLLAVFAAAMLLREPFGIGGIALAVGIGAAVQCAVLAAALVSARHWRPGRKPALDLARCAVATAVMAFALDAGLARAAVWLADDAGTMPRIAALAALCFGGAAVYAAAAVVTGALRPSALRRKSAPLA